MGIDPVMRGDQLSGPICLIGVAQPEPRPRWNEAEAALESASAAAPESGPTGKTRAVEDARGPSPLESKQRAGTCPLGRPTARDDSRLQRSPQARGYSLEAFALRRRIEGAKSRTAQRTTTRKVQGRPFPAGPACRTAAGFVDRRGTRPPDALHPYVAWRQTTSTQLSQLPLSGYKSWPRLSRIEAPGSHHARAPSEQAGNLWATDTHQLYT